MVIEDISPSFWNAFNFASFGPSDPGPATPAERVQVDALVGVTYTVAGDNSITADCSGNADLSACWVIGTPSATLTLPNLGSTPVASIRGLRFTYTKVDQSNWERPSNPIQTVVFTVDRRDTLVAANPSAVRPTRCRRRFTDSIRRRARPCAGVYTNEVTVTASGGDTSDPSPVWSATDIRRQAAQVPAPSGTSRDSEDPVRSAVARCRTSRIRSRVINRGGAHEKDLGALVVTDELPVDVEGPQLVIPDDPDTGQPYPVASAFTYTLLNASNQVQAAPTVTAVLGAATIPTQTLTFTLVTPGDSAQGVDSADQRDDADSDRCSRRARTC